MKRVYPVKKNRTLKENIKVILPLMFDDFMSYKSRVVGHPRLKIPLHRMRIQGKPMRYAMEFVEHALTIKFLGHHEEIKKVIEMMGEIHDCDVNIPELGIHLIELREFNKHVPSRQKIMIKPVPALIRKLREKRGKLYSELCETLNKWEEKDFRSQLVASMVELPRKVRG